MATGSLLGGCIGSNDASPAAEPASSLTQAEPQLKTRYLEALVREQPRHWRAYVRLAALQAAEQQDEKAFDSLRRAVEISPGNVGLWVSLAQAADQADYLDWTLYAWREAIRLDPDDPVTRLALGSFYRRLGWQSDANQQLAVAQSLAPNSLAVLRERAALFAVTGPLETARSLARELVKKFPQSPYGYSLLADMAADAGDWREAVEQGRAAVRRAPADDPVFLVRLAQFQVTRTDAPDPDEALSLLNRAVEKAPNDADVHYWLGVVYRRQGRQADAVREMEQAYRVDPGSGAVGLHLAELYRAAGRSDAAARLLNEYSNREEKGQKHRRAATRIVVKPLSPETHLEMASVHLENGRYGEAVVEYLTAQRLDPANTAAAKGVGTALERQSRSRESLAPLSPPSARATAAE